MVNLLSSQVAEGTNTAGRMGGITSDSVRSLVRRCERDAGRLVARMRPNATAANSRPVPRGPHIMAAAPYAPRRPGNRRNNWLFPRYRVRRDGARPVARRAPPAVPQ
jgi:hypothetical protein